MQIIYLEVTKGFDAVSEKFSKFIEKLSFFHCKNSIMKWKKTENTENYN
jgi:hypothetical protein